MKQGKHPKLTEALTKLLLGYGKELQFYGFYLHYVHFYEDNNMPMPTMCVGVMDMHLILKWDRGYVESTPIDEIAATLLHEVMHLLHHHPDRAKGYQPSVANIAMDMVVNHLIKTHHPVLPLPKLTKEEIEQHRKEALEKFPEKEKEINEHFNSIKPGTDKWIVPDPNYKGDMVFEQIYRWLQEQNQEQDGGDMSNSTKSAMKWATDGQTVDSHEELDETAEEIKQQLAEAALEKTKTAMRGDLPGNMEEMFKMLLKRPPENNLKLVKRAISVIKGHNKIKSYRRLNRRVPGVKGKIKQALELNALLDVSGSMYGRFDRVLSELFRDGYKINLIQVDTEIQKVEPITNKNQLQSIMIKGLGGTCLTPGIKFVNDPANKLSKFPTVILTDGYTDTLDFQGSMNQFLVLTTDQLCPVKNAVNVRQIVLKGC